MQTPGFKGAWQFFLAFELAIPTHASIVTAAIMSNPTANDDDIETFENAATSNASLSYPIQCSALRKNGHVLIKNRPCRIVDMSTSKTGKHGHAKVNLVGIDIFSGKKYEDMCPSTHNMEVPNIARHELQLIDIDDGFMSFMMPNGSTKDDVKVPEGDLGEQIQALFADGKDLLVTVIAAMGEEVAIAVKEMPK